MMRHGREKIFLFSYYPIHIENFDDLMSWENKFINAGQTKYIHEGLMTNDFIEFLARPRKKGDVNTKIICFVGEQS